MSQTTPKYELVPDALQWTLRKTHQSDKGNTVESIVGYYPKMHISMQAMYECLCRDECLTIPGDKESIQRAVAQAKAIFEEVTL